jgi:hypothetical protein
MEMKIGYPYGLYMGGVLSMVPRENPVRVPPKAYGRFGFFYMVAKNTHESLTQTFLAASFWID